MWLPDDYVLLRCPKCGMQQCAKHDSIEIEVFRDLHACNGRQHVSMQALDVVVQERQSSARLNR